MTVPRRIWDSGVTVAPAGAKVLSDH